MKSRCSVSIFDAKYEDMRGKKNYPKICFSMVPRHDPYFGLLLCVSCGPGRELGPPVGGRRAGIPSLVLFGTCFAISTSAGCNRGPGGAREGERARCVKKDARQ